MLASSSTGCWPTTESGTTPIGQRASSTASKRFGATLAVRVLDDARDFVPVGVSVEPDTDPAPTAHIRRHEEAVRFLIDHLGLHARRGRTPQRQPAVTVVIVEIHHERLLHEEGR